MRGVVSEVPTIPVSYCRTIAREAGVADQDMARLLTDCAEGAEERLADDELLTRSQLIAALRNATRLATDPAVGLNVGRALTPGTHGYLGFLAMASPDLQAALEAFGTYAPTRVSFLRYPTSLDDDWLSCEIVADMQGEAEAYQCAVEASLVVLMQIIETVLGRPLDGGRVELAFHRPKYAQRYADYISVPVSFDADRNRILIPRELAATKNAFADHQNYELALTRCQTLLRDLPEESNLLSDRVRSVLLSSPVGRLGEEAVAARLCVTKRTMARRLKREGSSFRQIRDEVLGAIAKSYLSDSDLPVESIAEILGYHDSASFRRAFKRWFAQTPTRYRQGFRRVTKSG